MRVSERLASAIEQLRARLAQVGIVETMPQINPR